MCKGFSYHMGFIFPFQSNFSFFSFFSFFDKRVQLVLNLACKYFSFGCNFLEDTWVPTSVN